MKMPRLMSPHSSSMIECSSLYARGPDYSTNENVGVVVESLRAAVALIVELGGSAGVRAAALPPTRVLPIVVAVVSEYGDAAATPPLGCRQR